MTPHGSALVTQLVSAVVMQCGSVGMTPHASVVVTPCRSEVVTQRGSPDVTGFCTRGESESETRLRRQDYDGAIFGYDETSTTGRQRI